jgi:hypothetical protein
MMKNWMKKLALLVPMAAAGPVPAEQVLSVVDQAAASFTFSADLAAVPAPSADGGVLALLLAVVGLAVYIGRRRSE